MSPSLFSRQIVTFLPLFVIHLFNKYLLTVYYVTDILLGTGETAEKVIVSALSEVWSGREMLNK